MDKVNNDISVIPINLMAPPASQTETSIALVWDKPERSSEIAASDEL